MKNSSAVFIGLVVLSIALGGCSSNSESTAQAPVQTATPAPAVEAADFVFTHGKVYTVDESNSWAEAVAVRGNEIVYVGDSVGAR